MLEILLKIPLFYMFRQFGWPGRLPMNLTLSITYKCNSRCKTCNIPNKKTEELSFQEWERFFSKFGKGLFWATISGGEPFLRKDIKEIVLSLYDKCQPSIINIPTNGLLKNKIPGIVKQIATYCKKARIVINLSFDEIEEKHDSIRGIQGNYENALETFYSLKSIDLPNLSIGIHTVISKYNVHRVPQIFYHLNSLNPDSYITEIAEEREELNTMKTNIAPEYKDYVKAVDFLLDKLKDENFSKVGEITRAFRIEYYQLVKKILKENRQIIPCYAGFASAQIAPDGDVWMCCVKAEPIGNLKETNYNFNAIWFAEKAELLRKSIKNEDCFCPLANASYTNMLHNYKSLSRAVWNLIKMR